MMIYPIIHCAGSRNASSFGDLDNFCEDIYGSVKINPTDAEDPQDFSFWAPG